jgi:hypothetical protein
MTPSYPIGGEVSSPAYRGGESPVFRCSVVKNFVGLLSANAKLAERQFEYILVKLKRITRLVLLMLLAGASHSTLAASAGTGGVSTSFSKNSTSLSLVVGSGTAFNDNYTILGLGVGYYVAEGLELGIDVERWISGDPTITKVSPQIRYVFTRSNNIKPYVGAFYRRTHFGEFDGIEIDDRDSFGYRAGAYFSTRNGVSIGGGVVYEEFKNCSALADCSTTNPELLFAVSF